MLNHRPVHLRRRPVNGRAFAENAVLIREVGGSRSAENGRWVAGESSETSVRVSVAPIQENDAHMRESLPDGMRDKEAIRFWIANENIEVLKSDPDGRRGDKLRYPAADGKTYLIVAVAQWHNITACLAVRDDGV